MSTTSTEAPSALAEETADEGLELIISRVIAATPERVYRAWTTQLPAWWGPHGMTTPVCDMDLRTGGLFRTVMRAPDGKEYPTRGIFLEVVKNERIVFTDAFDPEWVPHPDIFFVAIVTFRPLPEGKTLLTARGLHWTQQNREKHEKMGFQRGWGEMLDRLAAVAARA